MKVLRKLTSAHVLAAVALFVALGGPAGAAAVKLITGADIENHSISGIDVKRESLTGNQLRNGSVTGFDVRDGSLTRADFAASDLAQLVGPKGDPGAKGDQGAKGDTGPPGPVGGPASLESTNSTAPDITNYQDLEPIISAQAGAAGYYLAIASGTVTNTGGSDDYLNCGFDVDGSISGAAGFSTTAGNATSGSSVTLAPTTAPNQTVAFVCDGSGVTTFDLSNLKLKLIKLADE